MNSPDSSTDSAVKLDANGRPYSPDLSPFYATFHRPEPKPGYFVLPENVTQRLGDVPTWSCGVFACCFRQIESDIELHARMQQYAAGKPVTGTSGTLETAEQIDAEIARLEARKKELTEIKVGDWVVVKPGEATQSLLEGSVWNVIAEASDGGFCDGTKRCVSLGGFLDWEGRNEVHITRLRKATPAEVSAHLAKLEEEKRKVTVHSDDGRDYTAEFFPGYVQFGCAKIDNRMIRDCFDLMKQQLQRTSYGNRQITSIKIGKGTFTLEILEKLAANLKS